MTKGPSFSRKKGTLIALACAGAFSMPFAAQANSNSHSNTNDADMQFAGRGLTVSGAISIGIANVKATGSLGGNTGLPAAAGENSDSRARWNVWAGESNVRLSGSTRLTGGGFIKAYGWQMESGYAPDAGTSSASVGTLATRNSGVGMETSWGSIWAGKWDSPYKTAGGNINVITSPWGVGATNPDFVGNVGMGSATSGVGNSGTNIGDAMSFQRRQRNMVIYKTPEFLPGLVGELGISANEETPGGGNPTTRPQLWAGSIIYKNGPLYLTYAYEQHDDYLWGGLIGANAMGAGSTAAGTGIKSKDKGNKISGQYEFGTKTLVGVLWERLSYNQTMPVGAAANSITDLSRDMWLVSVVQPISGPHEIRAWYGRAGSYGCTPSCRGDTGARNFTLAYGYAVDKDTKLIANYSRLDNDKNANYLMSSAVLNQVTNGTTLNNSGQTQAAFSVGIQTRF